MTLNIIGLGLGKKEDISVIGLKTVKNSEFVFLENYTSASFETVENLEIFFGKKIILADRDLVEKNANQILEKAKKTEVSFLVIGDPMSATTHIDLKLRALDMGIKVEILHNASILTAVSETGLEAYKFGKVTSIPFDNQNIKAPIDVFNMNLKNNLHTLFLLDLEPNNQKYLTISESVDYLENNMVDLKTKALAIAHLGSKDQIIRYDNLKNLKKQDFGRPPFCLIIPAKLHFIEEEALKLLKDN